MKKKKVLKKALAGSRNIHFMDFLVLIEAFGFELKRTTGSHRIFKHPDIPALLSVQPSHDAKAKPYQIRQLIKLIEEYALSLDDVDLTEDTQEDDEE